MNWLENTEAEVIADFEQFWQELLTHLPAVVPVNTSPTATPLTLNQKMYEIVSHYNSGETKIYYPVRNDSSGTLDAYIGKNDPQTNQLVADLIVSSANDNKIDPYFLACVIQQESIYSPVTYNHNLSKSNLTPNFETTDWGIAQLSGKYLPSKPGMQGLSEEEMQTKALDANWAIPTMAQVYAGLLAQAVKELSEDPVLLEDVKKLNTTSLTDEQWLAALFYNRGISGGIHDVKTNATTLIAHPYHCATWYGQITSFAKNGIFVSAKSLNQPDESEYFMDHEDR